MSRRLVSITVVAISAAALSACGTGLHNKSYSQLSPLAFRNYNAGSLDLRNFSIEAPLTGDVIKKDGIATVTGSIVNVGASDDSLTGATSTEATDVTLESNGAATAAVPIPAQGDAGTAWSIVMTGLDRNHLVGDYISVTLEFAKAGTQTVSVPINPGNQDLDTRKADQDPYKPSE